MPYNKYQDRHMKCIEMHELKFLTIKQTYGIWDVSFGLWMQNAIPFFIGPSTSHENPIKPHWVLSGSLTMNAQWSLFSSKSQTFGLGPTIWADILGAIWGIFSQFISTHFGPVSPLSIFSINPFHYLLAFMSKSHLALVFQFGPQRLRNLVMLCPSSVAAHLTNNF